MAFAIRQRYRLAPTDPRFLDLTPEDIEAEYLSIERFDRLARGESVEEYEADSYDDDVAEILAGLEAGDADWETVIHD